MAQGIKNIQYDDLGKGLNMFTRDTMIANNESTDGWNVYAVGKNSISKRPGVVKFAEISGVSKIDGLGTYYNGATRKLLAMAGGKCYTMETGTAVQLSAVSGSAQAWTLGNRTDFCQAGGKVFIANGVENIKYYDGTNIGEIGVGSPGGSIVAKYLIFYKACLWAAGNPSVGNETRLYRSGDGSTASAQVGNFTYDATANPLATSKYVSQSDGQMLNGFFKHQDYLYPVKERSLWRASVGTDAAQLITIEMVDPARGTDSHHSIDTVENDNFMFNEIGVFATGYEPNILDQIRTNIVSLRVDPKLKSIQKNRLDDVEGVFYDNHYYLSFTSGGGTYNDTFLIYDRQRLGWWEWQVANDEGNYIGAACFTEFKDSNGQTRLYFGSPTDGSIYYFDTTIKQDPGYNITTNWMSKKFGIEKDYSQVKFFLDCELYLGKMVGDITVNIYIDGELQETWSGQIGNTGVAGIGVGTLGTYSIGVEGGSMEIADSGGGDFLQIPLNTQGRNIQIEITDTTSTKSWELNSIIIHYKPLNPLYQPAVKT